MDLIKQPQNLTPLGLRKYLMLLIILLTSAAIVFLALEPNVSYAQVASDLPTYGEIQDAANMQNDTSRTILQDLLGEFGVNPWTQAGPAQELLGSLFFIFNGALFVVGGIYLGYGMIVAAAQTANSGEVLGKNIDGFWVTIRMTLGVFGMVPAFSGFSLAQAFMLFTAILGIGIANLLNTAAIEKLDGYQAILPAPASSAINSDGALGIDVISQLLFMNVCAIANTHEVWMAIGPNENRIDVVPFNEKADSITITSQGPRKWPFGAKSNCGEITLNYSFRDSSGPLFGALGYRVNSVNYDNIKAAGQKIMASRIALLKELNDNIKETVNTWSIDTKGKFDTEFPSKHLVDLISYANEKEQAALNSIKADLAKTGQALTDGIKDNMKKGGWLSLGSWGATYAEVGAAMQSATSSELSIRVPNGYEGKGDYWWETLDPNSTVQIAYTNMAKALSRAYNEENKSESSCVFDGLQNETNNCSVGQAAILTVIDTIVNGSGGNHMVNPITASKQLGDFMLTTVSVVGAVSALDGVMDKIPGVGTMTRIGKKVVSTVGSASPVKKLGGWLKDILTNKFSGIMASVASAVLLFFLVGGIVFSIYIPFVPFVTWTTAVLSYFASVLEGLIAGQVWAFSHLTMNQEQGMGQRANQGYFFLMNMLLRPPLMVLGFFFATAIATLMGTFIFGQFGTALANVQGDSMTGLFSMIGILMVVMLLLLTLVQTAYNLIYELSDRTLQWFGHRMDASMAKEMDNKIEGGVKSGTHTAGMAVLGSKISNTVSSPSNAASGGSKGGN